MVWEATFHAGDAGLIFGDQEEMGFGARVATAITEKNSSAITSSSGLKTAKRTWGQPAEWCDYSGTVDGQRSVSSSWPTRQLPPGMVAQSRLRPDGGESLRTESDEPGCQKPRDGQTRRVIPFALRRGDSPRTD
jgi:hypothetical protein